MTEQKRKNVEAIIWYSIVIILTLIILTLVMQLWNADLRIPFGYIGDAIPWSMHIKAIIDNGWFMDNNMIGLPSGLHFQDYPTPIAYIHMIFFKLILIFTSDTGLVLNIYFLLTFVLTSITALFTFRKLDVRYETAVLGSLLFSFMPFHFLRGEAHLSFAAYYLIPLQILMVLWIYSNKSIFFRNINNKMKLNLLNKSSLFCLVICILVSCEGIYSAFFVCFFIFIAGISSLIKSKQFSNFLTALILIGIIFAGTILNHLPSFYYAFVNGSNPESEVAIRSSGESEIYGLKITQMLLPVSGHRISFLANLKEKYNGSAPLINENSTATLGFIGAVGFIFLIIIIFSNKDKFGSSKILKYLSELNLFAVLLATIGGFGAIFSFLILPSLRGYNRISIYISFFCILAILILIDEFKDILFKISKLQFRKLIYYFLLTILLIGGILDQTTGYYKPAYAELKSEFNNDRDFFQKVEASVPKGSKIFQLPYQTFPGGGPVVNMKEYEHLKGYIHTETLRWTYGAMKGRPGDIWQRNVVSKPTDEFVDDLALTDFNGIFINRSGYSDYGSGIESNLKKILNIQPIISSKNNYSFFSIEKYRENLKSKLSPQSWEQRKVIAEYPLELKWGKGFSILEGTNNQNWRWCSSEGELTINNDSKISRKAIIHFAIQTGYAEYNDFFIKSDLIVDNFKTNINSKQYSKEISIPPGKHIIKFISNAKRLNAPNDLRFLVFALHNFKLEEIDDLK
ncbi:MAG: hypothetical protein ACM3UU_02340 [Ignavibacteriales bacterium]